MAGVGAFGIAQLRQAAARRVDDSSLRAVAGEIGISFSGLRKFLVGGTPHASTVKKLTLWYAKHRTAPPQRRAPMRMARGEVDAAIERLRLYLEAEGDIELQRHRQRELRRRLFGGEL